jgi:Protein of unknown function (DUF5818)
MMQRLVRLSALIVPVLYLNLCPASLYGAPQMGDTKTDKASAASSQSVTGCLQKGDETGGFTLTGDDGKVWELHSKKVQLAGHVGHTVTVSGAAGNQSKATEEKIEGSEKKEAGEKEHGDLRVSSLKMVSDTCAK